MFPEGRGKEIIVVFVFSQKRKPFAVKVAGCKAQDYFANGCLSTSQGLP